MRKILVLLFFSFNVFAAEEIGYRGDSIRVGSVSKSVQKSVTITSDDQEVNAQRKAVVKIDSDSTIASLRSFVLRKGKEKSQVVQLRCNVSSSNKAELKDDASVPGAGQIKLSSDWICDEKWDNITLQWSGNHWYQIGRNDL